MGNYQVFCHLLDYLYGESVEKKKPNSFRSMDCMSRYEYASDASAAEAPISSSGSAMALHIAMFCELVWTDDNVTSLDSAAKHPLIDFDSGCSGTRRPGTPTCG